MNIYDLIVRLSGDGQSLRDDIEKDKLKVQELFDKFLEEHSIDLSTATATEKIDHLQQKLKYVKDAHASLRIDDIQAKMAVEEIIADMDRIRDEHANIMLTDEEASAKLDDLLIKLREFHDKTITLRVNDAEAVAKLDALDRRTKAVAQDAGGGGAGAGIGALLSLLPIAGPVSAAGTGGLMGLLSAAAPGMAGGTGFAAIATTTLKPVFSALSAIKTAEQQYQALLKNPAATNAQKLQALAQIKAATAGLNQEQVKALHSAQAFGSWWTNFAKQFQGSVVNVFTGFLTMIKNMMTDLAPAIKGFASGFSTLEKDASHALQSPFWKSFFSWLGAHARQSTISFGEAIGNLGKGFAALLQAFSPVATNMDKGLVTLTKRFADWASHLSATQGFKSFLNDVQHDGPLVLKIIGQLAVLANNLLRAWNRLGACSCR